MKKKTILEWCQEVKRSNKKNQEETMRNLVSALICFIHRDKNLEWIVIVDQRHKLLNPSVVQDFPFILIDFLVSYRHINIKIVISASADEEEYPAKRKGWRAHNISSFRFDETEFETWCDHYLIEGVKINHQSEEAVDALFWTGAVPYELDLLWK